MRFRTIILPFTLAIMLLITAVSCNSRWDTIWAIDFPENFRATWVCDDGNVTITKTRFTITSRTYGNTSGENEYRYKFDWVDDSLNEDGTVITLTPMNVSGSVGRVDTFTLNDDGTLSIEFGGINPRSYGPYTKSTAN